MVRFHGSAHPWKPYEDTIRSLGTAENTKPSRAFAMRNPQLANLDFRKYIMNIQPPHPAEEWSGELLATKKCSICTQYYPSYSVGYLPPIPGSEDCLYLDIYAAIRKSKNTLLPVIFWIHGGANLFGSGSDLNKTLMMDRDVVVFTFNYRLGPFGFLSTGDSVVPGNMGMKDQSLALRWVWNKIQNFGGDPKRVTLFGFSSGASRGISIGGVALAPWSRMGQARDKARKMAATVGCPTTCETEMVNCVQTRPANLLTRALDDYLQLNDNWNDIAPHMLIFNDTIPPNQKRQVAEETRKHYLGSEPIDRNSIIPIISMLGDRQWGYCMEKAMRLQAKRNKCPMWTYVYSYKTMYSITEALMRQTRKLGVNNGEDIYLVTVTPLMNVTWSSDVQMQQILLDIYISFATHGEPRMPQVDWQPVNPYDKYYHYLHIVDPQRIGMDTGFDFGPRSLWDRITTIEQQTDRIGRM
ncbi:Venom carboxylesterase-6 [Eufriesea mexicana]|uniref:Carboxylic ester hydrolase n=1 Tax=Eufriesea mexicana TaxID=516756 RepID=A0A310SGE4_9HYME|nr:Venom carboxylesterase-6 [Eufriesea mexicana]